jgi:hypothetical protein
MQVGNGKAGTPGGGEAVCKWKPVTIGDSAGGRGAIVPPAGPLHGAPEDSASVVNPGMAPPGKV